VVECKHAAAGCFWLAAIADRDRDRDRDGDAREICSAGLRTTKASLSSP